MKYIKTYKKHNEGIKSGLLTAGLAGSMLSHSPQTISNNNPFYDDKTKIETVDKDDVFVAKSNISELSKLRKTGDKTLDPELSVILNEIEQNLGSKDQSKFTELFNKLSKHLESKYGYKVEAKKVEEVKQGGVSSFVKGMSIFEILGWLGSISLAVCGTPQAWQSIKDKHSHGISWGFVLLWAFGEIFALAYVYDKLDTPLLLNYATNILILSVILYFKISPKNTTNYETPK